MAAALYPPAASSSGPQALHSGSYQRALMNEYDFKDNRYPTLPTAQSSKAPQKSNEVLLGSENMPAWEKEAKDDDEYFRQNNGLTGDPSSSSQDWDQDQPSTTPQQQTIEPPIPTAPSMRSNSSQGQQSQEQLKSAVSYALPAGAPRRVVERYSLEDSQARSKPTTLSPRIANDNPTEETRSNTPQPPQQRTQRIPDPIIPSSPRHPSLPQAGIGAGPSQSRAAPPIMPLSASPTYNPPVSPRQRAYAQQPYIQNISPQAANPYNVQEEVCLECAMRDQDMADVDVTSPGVWDRESDVLYEELKQREEEEEATGVINTEIPPRPRSKGGLLTEQNLKLWLSVNPREPTSRQQTLNSFIKSQRALLNAEAEAHSRALQEARQLDSRMRDAYSQLRRSAYDTGSSAAPVDDSGGIRIKPPSSPAAPVFNTGHERTASRDVTLLENGMIVEHVDVRREEREVRSRQKRDERRARKSSRGSVIDVNSYISGQSLMSPHTDAGIGTSPYTRLSQASGRPTSVLTAPYDNRPDIPRAYSQASFSDLHSFNSPSPRRSRFFGSRASGWMSQDSLAASGMSGSMVDMHVALQRDANRAQLMQSPVDNRRTEYWPNIDLEPVESRQSSQKTKKKKGLAKIWQIVTRSSKQDKAGPREASSPTGERTDDDLPLAPPPPLSYLVNRMPGEPLSNSPRHASTPSLPSTTSPKFAMSSSVSPPTAPSSSIPSPASSRQSGADQDTLSPEGKQLNENPDFLDVRVADRVRSPSPGPKNVHAVQSEPDIRGRASPRSTSPAPPLPNSPNNISFPQPSSPPVAREKSLPPLPPEAIPRANPIGVDTRPRTLYTTASPQTPNGIVYGNDYAPPQAPFRTPETRRQSFGGITSRPIISNILNKTINGRTTPDPKQFASGSYNEFGSSRRSLGLKDLMNSPVRHSVPGPNAATTPGKRRSRFALSSLFGKKNQNQNQDQNLAPEEMEQYVAGWDGQDDGTTNYAPSTTNYAASMSRHSMFSATTNGNGAITNGQPQRHSMASRKGLEDLVAQDPEFVAYRYPSQDQHLALFTR